MYCSWNEWTLQLPGIVILTHHAYKCTTVWSLFAALKYQTRDRCTAKIPWLLKQANMVISVACLFAQHLALNRCKACVKCVGDSPKKCEGLSDSNIPWSIEHDSIAVTTHCELFTHHMTSSWHNILSTHSPHAFTLESMGEVKTRCGSDIMSLSCNLSEVRVTTSFAVWWCIWVSQTFMSEVPLHCSTISDCMSWSSVQMLTLSACATCSDV